jgi:hypothetical protein
MLFSKHSDFGLALNMSPRSRDVSAHAPLQRRIAKRESNYGPANEGTDE